MTHELHPSTQPSEPAPHDPGMIHDTMALADTLVDTVLHGQPPLKLDESVGVAGPQGVGSTSAAPSAAPTGTAFPITFSPLLATKMIDDLELHVLNKEAVFLRHFIPSFGLTSTKEPYKMKSMLVKAFKEHFSSIMEPFTDALLSAKIRTDTTLNQSIPALTEEITKLKAIADSLTSLAATTLPPPIPDPLLMVPPLITPELEDHVSLTSIEINDIPINDLLDELKRLKIKFRQVGMRYVIHFGRYYKYGKVAHDPRKYPDSPLLQSIYNKMKVLFPELDISTHSCTVTLYPDGRYFMPRHHDNEKYIKPGSWIRTAVLGDERPIVFTNTVGPLQELSYMLTHGSVYSMTRSSQEQWSHAIPIYPSCTGPRVSIAYRELIDPEPEIPTSQGSSKPKPPPIAPPPSAQATPVRRRLMPESFYDQPKHAKPVRILVLSESNNIALPTNTFPENHVVIVKPLMQLTKLPEYEKEFQYSDYVVISSGINELTRYNYTGTSLFEFISPLLRKYCEQFPKTTFVLSSVLRTSRSFSNLSRWLNPSVNTYNNLLFDLTLEIKRKTHNLFFLDIDSTLDPSYSINSRGNGVHTVLDAKKNFTRILKLSLCLLTTPVNTSNKLLQDFVWPLRPSFWTRAKNCC